MTLHEPEIDSATIAGYGIHKSLRWIISSISLAITQGPLLPARHVVVDLWHHFSTTFHSAVKQILR